MAAWYYVEQGQRKGPVEEAEIRAMAEQGAVGPDTLVWSEGMANWQAAKTALGLAQEPAQQAAISATPRSSVDAPVASEAEEKITNYLPWSIVVTVLCCIPFGVASIVYAAKANSAKQAGDFITAKDAARKAKLWLIWAIVIGFIANILVAALQFAAGMAQALSN